MPAHPLSWMNFRGRSESALSFEAGVVEGLAYYIHVD